MAQYRRTVFNLSNGPGEAINDPRADEARALEASHRADRALALQAQGQAMQSMQAQRQADLQQEQMQTEAALAAQRSQAPSMINAAMAQAMRTGGGQPGAGPGPAMGRDDMNRQAHAMAGVQDILSGGQAARGMDYNTRNATPHGVQTFAPVPSSSPMHDLTAKQATWQNGLMGDFTDPGMQVTGQNQVMARDKQAAEINDMLAKLGLAKQGQNAALQHQQFQEGMDKQKQAADIQDMVARLGLADRQTAVQENTLKFNREDVSYGRNEAEKARKQKVTADAADWLAKNVPNAFTSGDTLQEKTGILSQLRNANPEVAAEVLRMLQDPEVQSRAQLGSQSWLRPSGPINSWQEALVRKLGVSTNEQQAADAQARLQHALMGGLGAPFDPSGVPPDMSGLGDQARTGLQGIQGQREQLSAEMQNVMNEILAQRDQQEQQYQEGSRRPSRSTPYRRK